MTGTLMRCLLDKVRSKRKLVECLPESHSVAFEVCSVGWMSYQTPKIVPTELLGKLS